MSPGGVWRSVLPPGKLSGTSNDPVRDDPTLDMLTLAPDDMTSLQRRAARAIAERVRREHVAPRLSDRVARQMLPLRADDELLRLLERFTTSVCGALPYLCFCVGDADPSVVVTLPPDGHLRSGGPCPPHQDYTPQGRYARERSLNFYMLLQDTTERHGPTFVYPRSRHLVCRDRYEDPPRSAGRPRKRRRGEAAGEGRGELQPQSLHRDLRARCGECVRLTGEELTLFRHESAEWHGALPNASAHPRAVLIWSYCSAGLVGQFVRTVDAPG